MEGSSMKVTAHPEFEKWRHRIKIQPQLFQPWTGAVYRVTTLNYPDPKSILLGEGSFRYGGRWNAVGSFRAVYGSTEDTVAVAESRANAEYAGMSYPFRTPRLLVTIEFSLRRVVDLSFEQVRKDLDINLEMLSQEDWRKIQEQRRESFTQTLGRAVFENGGEGLLAPSARIPSGVNVVYFPWNKQGASVARVYESEQLDRLISNI
jgi:RES domain-containing protein